MWRLVRGAALVAVVATAVSGCTPASTTLARVSGDTIEFLVCDEIEADVIEVSVGQQTVWSLLNLEGALGPSTLISVGTAPPGYEVTVPFTASALPADSFVTLVLTDTGGRRDAAGFDRSRLGPDWIDVSGASRPRGCR